MLATIVVPLHVRHGLFESDGDGWAAGAEASPMAIAYLAAPLGSTGKVDCGDETATAPADDSCDIALWTHCVPLGRHVVAARDVGDYPEIAE